MTPTTVTPLRFPGPARRAMSMLDLGIRLADRRSAAFRCFPSSFPARACRSAPPSDDIERSGDPDDKEEPHGPGFERTRGVASDRSGPGVLLVGGSRTAVLLVGTYNGKAGQYTSIQSAANKAQPGDYILVAPGDHHEDYDTHVTKNQFAEHGGSRRCGGAHIGPDYPGNEP